MGRPSTNFNSPSTINRGRRGLWREVPRIPTFHIFPCRGAWNNHVDPHDTHTAGAASARRSRRQADARSNGRKRAVYIFGHLDSGRIDGWYCWGSWGIVHFVRSWHRVQHADPRPSSRDHRRHGERSEEHTSELQSRGHLVCRLLLEKKKDNVSV